MATAERSDRLGARGLCTPGRVLLWWPLFYTAVVFVLFTASSSRATERRYKPVWLLDISESEIYRGTLEFAGTFRTVRLAHREIPALLFKATNVLTSQLVK